MRTLIVILFLILGLMFLYKVEKDCASSKSVLVWEENGVQVVQEVKVYDCGA